MLDRRTMPQGNESNNRREAVTPQNILSGFKSYGTSPFDPSYFLQNLPPARLTPPSHCGVPCQSC